VLQSCEERESVVVHALLHALRESTILVVNALHESTISCAPHTRLAWVARRGCAGPTDVLPILLCYPRAIIHHLDALRAIILDPNLYNLRVSGKLVSTHSADDP
jgi:hypothetical protein